MTNKLTSQLVNIIREHAPPASTPSDSQIVDILITIAERQDRLLDIAMITMIHAGLGYDQGYEILVEAGIPEKDLQQCFNRLQTSILIQNFSPSWQPVIDQFQRRWKSYYERN